MHGFGIKGENGQKLIADWAFGLRPVQERVDVLYCIRKGAVRAPSPDLSPEVPCQGWTDDLLAQGHTVLTEIETGAHCHHFTWDLLRYIGYTSSAAVIIRIDGISRNETPK